MKHRLAILILLIATTLAPAPPVHFTARLDSKNSATIQWNQQSRGCLWAAPNVFVGCYDGARHVVVTLGHKGPLDGELRPMPGVVYILEVDGVVRRAPLRRGVYFPVWMGR
jgi:hypothetical protein